ncbi:phage tail tape measure protein, partial [Candidatus Pacearchaeota archaeon]|nr:phage tail tape measure protein [Candidatus Pacearchaeota archaeon]
MATQRAVMKIDGDAASAIKSLTIVFEKVDQLGTAVNNFGNKAKAGGEKAAKGFKKVAKEVDNVGKKSKNTQTRISKLTRTFQGMAKVAGLVSRAMMFSSRALMQVRNAYMAVTDAARLATQGFTNFGRSMFFFVSLPLIGFFKGLITASVDFEDQMVRVGKTTGLWGESLERVSQGIRALARVTSTSHVDLATMAEQIGQLGITSEAAIVELTELFNMLAVTTNIAASEVATKMGKISNAFGWHLSESRDEVTRLANTINYLENTTAASADEILNALYKIAAVAGTLDISASDAAAFAASLISFGFSAEEAGTAVRNLAYYMSQNTEEIYNAMKGYEKYNTKAKVTTAMNEDFASVIIDISDALEDEEENVNALVNAIEIGNLRGGKALAAFGNAFRSLGQNLANASGEWDRATSLMDEYEKAMSSTKAQMGLLKNNINDVGITIGETLLPFINKIILVMVPAIQDLNKWFGALADKTQMLYIGFALLLVIAGPIVMFLGQMMHGVTLLMMGFGQLIKVFALAAKGIGGIALGFNKLVGLFGGTSMSLAVLVGWIKGVFAFLATSLFGWIAVITVAVVAILKVLQKMGVDIAGFFLKIAESAREWGQKLMETYGTGLAKGFNYVLTLVAWIAEQIAGFFRSSSPPKVGPLKTIDKWGAKLMATYLRGFYLADFDILSGIGRIIEKYLTFGKRGDDSKMASALRNVLKARVALSKLIDIYNKTGAIDASLMAATTKGLGHMTEHVQKLIGLWLEYNRLQQKILELEERRKDVVKGYQAEVEGISGSNMSLEDKVNAIRQAQFARDDELRLIDAETAALEEKSDEMQDQLKWQQKFVDAMMAQDDIMERLNATLDKLSKAMENMGGLGGEIGSAFEEAFVAVEETFDSIVERLDQGRLLWDAFLKGFSGEDLDMNLEQYMDTEQWSDYRSFFELGAKIGEVKDQAVEAWEKITTFAISLKDIWD